jgi:hypothetical protein
MGEEPVKSIPSQHVARLEQDLREHERMEKELEARRANLDSEIQAHQLVLALGRNKKVLDALAEVAGDPQLTDEINRDPQAFAKARGIELPAGLKVHSESRPRLRVEAASVTGNLNVTLVWDAADGFSLHAEYRGAATPPRQPS